MLFASLIVNLLRFDDMGKEKNGCRQSFIGVLLHSSYS